MLSIRLRLCGSIDDMLLYTMRPVQTHEVLAVLFSRSLPFPQLFSLFIETPNEMEATESHNQKQMPMAITTTTTTYNNSGSSKRSSTSTSNNKNNNGRSPNNANSQHIYGDMQLNGNERDHQPK